MEKKKYTVIIIPTRQSIVIEAQYVQVDDITVSLRNEKDIIFTTLIGNVVVFEGEQKPTNIGV